MLPEVEEDLSEGYEVEEEPSLTWKLNFDSGRVAGMVDGIDAVRQAVYCILNTERYESLAYSWDYGVEFMDLFGEPMGYVLPELERRVKEALTQDDRIEDVTDFSFDLSGKGVVKMAFTVKTIYGNTDEKKEVAI